MGEIQSHHSPEELPVAKVHLHLLLQLVQVAVSKHLTIYISLQRTGKTLTSLFAGAESCMRIYTF